MFAEWTARCAMYRKSGRDALCALTRDSACAVNTSVAYDPYSDQDTDRL